MRISATTKERRILKGDEKQMEILMRTKNPGKIEGAKQAFEKYFHNVEIEGIPVSSNVGDQPINEEILQGAKNRVKNLREYAISNNIQADFYVSSKAGISFLTKDEVSRLI